MGAAAGAVPGLAQAVAETSSSPASPAAIQSTAPDLAVRRVTEPARLCPRVSVPALNVPVQFFPNSCCCPGYPRGGLRPVPAYRRSGDNSGSQRTPGRDAEKMAGAAPSPVARSARIRPTTGVNLKPWPEKPAPITSGPDAVEDEVLVHGGGVGAADVGEGVGVHSGEPGPGVALQRRHLRRLGRERPPVRVHYRPHAVPAGLDSLAGRLHPVDRGVPVRELRARPGKVVEPGPDGALVRNGEVRRLFLRDGEPGQGAPARPAVSRSRRRR